MVADFSGTEGFSLLWLTRCEDVSSEPLWPLAPTRAEPRALRRVWGWSENHWWSSHSRTLSFCDALGLLAHTSPAESAFGVYRNMSQLLSSSVLSWFEPPDLWGFPRPQTCFDLLTGTMMVGMRWNLGREIGIRLWEVGRLASEGELTAPQSRGLGKSHRFQTDCFSYGSTGNCERGTFHGCGRRGGDIDYKASIRSTINQDSLKRWDIQLILCVLLYNFQHKVTFFLKPLLKSVIYNP